MKLEGTQRGMNLPGIEPEQGAVVDGRRTVFAPNA